MPIGPPHALIHESGEPACLCSSSAVSVRSRSVTFANTASKRFSCAQAASALPRSRTKPDPLISRTVIAQAFCKFETNPAKRFLRAWATDSRFAYHTEPGAFPSKDSAQRSPNQPVRASAVTNSAVGLKGASYAYLRRSGFALPRAWLAISQPGSSDSIRTLLGASLKIAPRVRESLAGVRHHAVLRSSANPRLIQRRDATCTSCFEGSPSRGVAEAR